MKTQFQLIGLTVFLTVLIWTYADRSGYETRLLNPVTVRIVLPGDATEEFVIRGNEGQIGHQKAVRTSIEVTGPKAVVDRLERENNNAVFELKIVLTDELAPGTRSIGLATHIEEHPDLQRRGLTVGRVEPPTAQVFIDHYKTITFDLALDAGGFKKVLESNPTVEPNEVTARVLESEYEKVNLPQILTLRIEDDIDQQRDRGFGQTGEPMVFNVPLSTSLLGVDAKFITEQVIVSVQLKQEMQLKRLTIRPLKYLIGVQDFSDQYRIEWKDKSKAFLTQVIRVRVQVERAEQLKPEMINAYIEINPDDLPQDSGLGEEQATGPWREAPVRFHFPPGYENVVIDWQQQETVAFRIIHKSGPESIEPLSTTNP